MSLNGKRRRRVLVIDEEPATADWLRQILEAEGYDVRAALSGEAGEELFRHWRPDVVLTGLTLPDIDGIQLLKQLRESDPQPETIVIGSQGTIHRAVEAGRSEEHTSELQSQSNLVCRLLLEKKKKKKQKTQE